MTHGAKCSLFEDFQNENYNNSISDIGHSGGIIVRAGRKTGNRRELHAQDSNSMLAGV